MKAEYEDILALTDKEPDWYDQDGVPRYAPFHPELCPDIYANEVILLKIQCQACGKLFRVEMHWNAYQDKPSISDAIKEGNLGYLRYGDPPRHGVGKDDTTYCYAGDTMLSESVEILEFWRNDRKWKRKKKYEIKWEAHNDY